jgi:hypothetical protein
LDVRRLLDFDQDTVRVETPSAELTITQRSEIAVFEKRFAWLQESAVYGAEGEPQEVGERIR